MRPIAIIGTGGAVPDSWRLSSARAFQATGFNTGNLAFQGAVRAHVADPAMTIPFHFDPADIRGAARMIVIPAANFLGGATDFADFAARLEATGLPLLAIGLGIQATDSLDEIVLSPGTDRLLRLFAERGPMIGVRGAHTAAFLERNGVGNFVVLGCPSNFLDTTPDLGARIAARIARIGAADARIAVAPTFYAHNITVELLIHTQLDARIAAIVCQEPLAAVALARGDRGPELDAWAEREATFLLALSPTARAAARDRLRSYFAVDAWLEAYRRCDLVLGTRIHGSALGWQAGRPACVIAHDLRTDELADAMGLPKLAASAIGTAGLLDQVRAAVMAKAATYDAHRAAVAARYCALLSAAGVTPAAGLMALADNR